jgi:hypothetical protein
MTTTYNLDTPEGRAAAIEALGADAYNEAMKAHQAANTIETVNGYALRYVVSGRFGRLISVDDTGNAYAHLEDARRFANSLGRNVTWKEVTEARYMDMLEMVPPAVMGPTGFMVGEPASQTAEGELTFAAFRQKDGKHYEADRPMTVREFRRVCPTVRDYAYSEKGAL